MTDDKPFFNWKDATSFAPTPKEAESFRATGAVPPFILERTPETQLCLTVAEANAKIAPLLERLTSAEYLLKMYLAAGSEDAFMSDGTPAPWEKKLIYYEDENRVFRHFKKWEEK